MSESWDDDETPAEPDLDDDELDDDGWGDGLDEDEE